MNYITFLELITGTIVFFTCGLLILFFGWAFQQLFGENKKAHYFGLLFGVPALYGIWYLGHMVMK